GHWSDRVYHASYPRSASKASAMSTLCSTLARSVCSSISGFAGGSYRSETPVKAVITAAIAFLRSPLASRSVAMILSSVVQFDGRSRKARNKKAGHSDERPVGKQVGGGGGGVGS